MFDYQIRRATQHDFATIIRLVHALLGEMYALRSTALSDQGEAWLDFEGRILQTLSCAEDNVSRYPCAAGRYIAHHLLEIAELIGEAVLPIGLIEASSLQPTPIFRPVRTLYIHALYVLPHYRRRGVGTALLCAAIEWGQQRGCRQAQLSVLPHNPARRVYQTLGFTVRGLEMCQELTATR